MISGSPCTYHLNIAPMSVLGYNLKCPDMAKLLLLEQYIIAVSVELQQRCPQQFLDSAALSQAQQGHGIQVQPVQYMCNVHVQFDP